MKKIKIYHNQRCSKSREALAMIREKGFEPEICEYLKTPPSYAELKDVLMRLHLKPQEIIRTGEELYKKKFRNKKFSDDEWIKILSENPELIERPIVVKGSSAAVGRPIENIIELLEKKR
jgi:arsenate reductase (glutaredoxin)